MLCLFFFVSAVIFHYVKQVEKGELAAEQNRNQRCFVTIFGKDEKIQPCRCHLVEMKILVSK
jgi:hypothetical protein